MIIPQSVVDKSDLNLDIKSNIDATTIHRAMTVDERSDLKMGGGLLEPQKYQPRLRIIKPYYSREFAD